VLAVLIECVCPPLPPLFPVDALDVGIVWVCPAPPPVACVVNESGGLMPIAEPDPIDFADALLFVIHVVNPCVWLGI
jgi:hypothetical protein